jgi:hypothetical protein
VFDLVCSEIVLCFSNVVAALILVCRFRFASHFDTSVVSSCFLLNVFVLFVAPVPFDSQCCCKFGFVCSVNHVFVSIF